MTRALELGLAAFLILAPLPFGAVRQPGRSGLELFALLLMLLWLARSIKSPPVSLARPIMIGVAGLLILGMLQALPLGSATVNTISPESMTIRLESEPSPEALDAEKRFLGVEPASLNPPPALSVDPPATAAALRTGVALSILFVITATVVTARGARVIALALLVSAGIQGLYGMLVLATGYDRIWHIEKASYLEAATGTFINKNHFACYLAMALSCGLGLILASAPNVSATGFRTRLVALFSDRGVRSLLLVLLFTIGLAGLMTSFSRAGILVGLTALLFVILTASKLRRLKQKMIVAILILVAASIPLVQLGSDKLVSRYGASVGDLTKAGARLEVWQDTLSIVTAFPVVGSGFGTYSAIYPLYRSPEVRLFYAHAHNDYLQVIAEGGIIGGILLMLVLWPLFRITLRVLAGAKGILAVGFAAGLLAIALHSLVDFNFHIPANAATAAILAGVVLGLPWKDQS